MAGGLPSIYWTTSGRQPGPGNEPFLQWLADLSSASNPPLVLSISYSDNEYTVDPAVFCMHFSRILYFLFTFKSYHLTTHLHSTGLKT
mmetsp:Transcript_66215/g.147816  ORF Transcript_66215/g.147816 Transcript_66215/m.147816 type:complete len:88 (+) Transcript_66215:799-1062(+)